MPGTPFCPNSLENLELPTPLKAGFGPYIVTGVEAAPMFLVEAGLEAVLTKDNKVLFQKCRPTDSLISTLFAKGMVARLGETVRPSVALLDCHILSGF